MPLCSLKIAILIAENSMLIGRNVGKSPSTHHLFLITEKEIFMDSSFNSFRHLRLFR